MKKHLIVSAYANIFCANCFSQLIINVREKMDLEKELYNPVIQKFERVKIYTPGIDHIWGADLRILTTFSKEHKGYKYILAVIDIFSK